MSEETTIERRIATYHNGQRRCYAHRVPAENWEFHGEVIFFHANGQVLHNFFALCGKVHGLVVAFNNDGKCSMNEFFFNDMPIMDFPFLPEKPPRLLKGYSRNRFENLELA